MQKKVPLLLLIWAVIATALLLGDELDLVPWGSHRDLRCQDALIGRRTTVGSNSFGFYYNEVERWCR